MEYGITQEVMYEEEINSQTSFLGCCMGSLDIVFDLLDGENIKTIRALTLLQARSVVKVPHQCEETMNYPD